ncbi:hypothetical protein JXM67_04625 [candidate division WOR-3 bacterium]|nr:hypothetical protein [candidate division WOR-3 bacterium]
MRLCGIFKVGGAFFLLGMCVFCTSPRIVGAYWASEASGTRLESNPSEGEVIYAVVETINADCDVLDLKIMERDAIFNDDTYLDTFVIVQGSRVVIPWTVGSMGDDWLNLTGEDYCKFYIEAFLESNENVESSEILRVYY